MKPGSFLLTFYHLFLVVVTHTRIPHTYSHRRWQTFESGSMHLGQSDELAHRHFGRFGVFVLGSQSAVR